MTKQTQVVKLRKYIDKHPIFTIKDVLRVTNCNNPYDVIFELRKQTTLWNESVKNRNGVRFRLFMSEWAADYKFVNYLRRHGLIIT